MFRKTSLVFLVIVFILSFQSVVLGDGTPKVRVNGQLVNSEAKIIDDRIYLPVRAVGEAIGADVYWNEETSTAELKTTSQDTLVPAIVKKVSPSVVGIIGNWKDSGDYVDDTKYVEQYIHGTGIIIGGNGEILTNAHVVKDMGRIIVVLYDGTAYEANILCMDEESDLAKIKINKTGLTPAEFCNEEDIVIGKMAITIGTPISFSLRNSASLGIVSGMDRSVDSYYRLIQTDAAINPGNSGGPLVNAQGKVMGVNSSKFLGVGIEGLGFSIPIGTIKYVLRQFELYGRVKRPSLSVYFEEDWTARYGLPSDAGLRITEVKKGSDAETQGVLANDMLLSVGNDKVHSLTDLNELMKKHVPGDKVTVKIKRDKAIISLIISLEEYKKEG